MNTERVSANARQYVAAEDFVYFVAFDALHGHELWRTDGTIAGTLLVKDIRIGPEGSRPDIASSGNGYYGAYYEGDDVPALLDGNILIFTADDGTHGREVWRTDGTANGTFMLRDISADNRGYRGWYSDLEFRRTVGNEVFFSRGAGSELWKTDGTQHGTVLVKSFDSGPHRYPMHAASLNGKLVFSANDGQHGMELWTSDGTPEGTTLLRDSNPNGDGVAYWCGHRSCTFPLTTHPKLDVAFYRGNNGDLSSIWVTDGTTGGTFSLGLSVTSSYFGNTTTLVPTDNAMFIAVLNANTNSYELWKSDGTRNGTTLGRSWGTEAYTSSLVADENIIYFAIRERAHESNTSTPRLWRSDGTAEGTYALTVTSEAFTHLQPVGIVGDSLFFNASGPPGYDGLWRLSDEGVSFVTRRLSWTVSLQDRLIFGSDDGVWSTDESASDVQHLIQDSTVTGRSRLVTNGELFITGPKGQVWKTDGTADGTMQVSEIPVSTWGSSPGTFVAYRGKNYFLADQASDLYEHDPSTGNSRLLRVGSVQPDTLRVYDDRLFFIQNGELWSTDVASPARVTASASNSLFALEVVGDTLYLLGRDGLWKSDGTKNGTVRVKLINYPRDLLVWEDTIYVLAEQLWRSDGTEAGTKAVSLTIGGESLGLNSAGVFIRTSSTTSNNNLSQTRTVLWHHDPSTESTVKVKEFTSPGVSYFNQYSSWDSSVSLGNLVVFAEDDGEHGAELWSSDGSTAGTRLIADLEVQERTTGSMPSDFVRAGAASYFIAQGAGGKEVIWRVPDEAPDQAHVVADDLLATSNLTPFGSRVLFSASRDNATTTPSLWITGENGEDAFSLALAGQPWYPADITVVGNLAYFAGANGNGNELWRTDGTRAGTSMVADLAAGDASADPSHLTAVGDTLFFTANTRDNGRELWKSNGTAESTMLVRDLNLGPESTILSDFTPLGSQLLFVAETRVNGRELWITNGSEAGTHVVDDLRVGVTEGSFAEQYVQVGELIYFIADDGVQDRELWRTDGTTMGTSLVGDLGSTDRNIGSLRAVGDSLFFTADSDDASRRELWVVTSPDAKPQPVRTSESDDSRVLEPDDFSVVNGQLYGSAQTRSNNGRGLFRVNVTPNGVLGVLLPGPENPAELMVVGDRLFFAADNALGRELWQTDGTEAGTHVVMDIFDELAVASEPGDFVQVGTRVFFTATDPTHGRELWSTDGTPAGTGLVLDVQQGRDSSSPRELTEFQGKVVFSAEASSERGRGLWISDGTAEGTRSVRNLNHAVFPLDPRSITATGGSVYFFASILGRGVELWKSDGTHNGTSMISNVSVNRAGVIHEDEILAVVGNHVYFTADDGTHGRELWTSDGSPAGTKMVKDIRVGSAAAISVDVTRHHLVPDEQVLYFAADSDGSLGPEIWVTDGTDGGTRMVHRATADPSGAVPLDVVDGWLYFSSRSTTQGNELWRTDGTTENATLIADLSPGASSSTFFPGSEFTPIGAGRFMFPAATEGAGTELWITDGTTNATYPLDLEAGKGSTDFGDSVQVRVIDDTAYFLASVPSKGSGLWKSDGTVAGTELVLQSDLHPWPDLRLLDDRLFFGGADITGGLAIFHEGTVGTVTLNSPNPSGSSAPTELIAGPDRLYFVADDGRHGREIWQSDGTVGGTQLLADLRPGLSSVAPRELTAIGQQLFFSGSTPTAGRELWVMSTSGENPTLVRDIRVGPDDTDPSGLMEWQGQLLFTIDDPLQGSTLWLSDGSEPGTRPLLDPSSGVALLNPRVATIDDNRLFVFAESLASESWLWRLDTPSGLPVAVARASAQGLQAVVGERLYFTGFDPLTGYEPWSAAVAGSDARPLADLNKNLVGSNPDSLSIVGEFAYFTANIGTGRELWQSDGTAIGTRTVSSFIPELPSRPTNELRTTESALFLTQRTGAGTELWKVDPSSNLATQLWRDSEEQQFKSSLGVVGDQWFFMAHQPAVGTELWVSDGTAEGTRLVRDVSPGDESSAISNWTAFKDGYLFVMISATGETELWFTDGTASEIYSIVSFGAAGLPIGPIHVAGEHVLFAADDGTHGMEPWISDGTRDGTRMLVNFDTSTVGANPSWLTAVGEYVYFAASDGDGNYLWRWSPALGVPEKVSSIVQNPTGLVAKGEQLFFSGYHPEFGYELWGTDGTADGTRLISDVVAGPESSAPNKITITDRGDILFSAVDEAHGREAWWLPPLGGDTNADRDVDFEDFLAFSDHFGQSGTQNEGDFDQDGLVGFSDFLILSNNFGRNA